MAHTVAALTGVIADMAALETEFQANWTDLDVMKTARRSNLLVQTDLAGTQTLRVFVRAPSATAGGVPIWYQHQDGVYTIPAKVTTGTDEWSGSIWNLLGEWSGIVVWASAAATIIPTTTDNP